MRFTLPNGFFKARADSNDANDVKPCDKGGGLDNPHLARPSDFHQAQGDQAGGSASDSATGSDARGLTGIKNFGQSGSSGASASAAIQEGRGSPDRQEGDARVGGESTRDSTRPADDMEGINPASLGPGTSFPGTTFSSDDFENVINKKNMSTVESNNESGPPINNSGCTSSNIESSTDGIEKAYPVDDCVVAATHAEPEPGPAREPAMIWWKQPKVKRAMAVGCLLLVAGVVAFVALSPFSTEKSNARWDELGSPSCFSVDVNIFTDRPFWETWWVILSIATLGGTQEKNAVYDSSTIDLQVDGVTYSAAYVGGSATDTSVEGGLCDCGDGSSRHVEGAGRGVDQTDLHPCNCKGQVCLMRQQEDNFSRVIGNCEYIGGLAIIIYSAVEEPLSTWFGFGNIPAAFVSQTHGQYLLEHSLGKAVAMTASRRLQFRAEALHPRRVCLPKGEYEFAIYDWGFDGICCGSGHGYYSVISSGALIAEGGDFGSEESTRFTLPFVPAQR